MTEQPNKTGLAKPKRSSLRFTLRAMLLFMAIIALWLGVQVNKAHKQRAAVAAIEAAGGSIFYDWMTDGKQEPTLSWRSRITGFNADAQPVWIVTSKSAVTADVLRYLQDLPLLETVWLEDTYVGDEGDLATALPKYKSTDERFRTTARSTCLLRKGGKE